MSNKTMLDMVDEKGIEYIAKYVHGVNRKYCMALGDYSQEEWDNCPDWQKTSAINGVRFVLDKNCEVNSEETHNSWLKEKESDGWIYGEEKDPDKRTHPCMVPYDDLPENQKFKDYLFQMGVFIGYTSVIGS